MGSRVRGFAGKIPACSSLTPLTQPPFGVFGSSNIFENLLFSFFSMEEAWKRVWGSLMHIIIASPWKNTFWKMPLHVFFYKKIQKEAFWGVQEARKEEDLGRCIPAPETRTNLGLFAKRFMKIGPKSTKWEPKSTGQLEKAAPLVWVSCNLTFSNHPPKLSKLGASKFIKSYNTGVDFAHLCYLDFIAKPSSKLISWAWFFSIFACMSLYQLPINNFWTNTNFESKLSVNAICLSIFFVTACSIVRHNWYQQWVSF